MCRGRFRALARHTAGWRPSAAACFSPGVSTLPHPPRFPSVLLRKLSRTRSRRRNHASAQSAPNAFIDRSQPSSPLTTFLWGAHHFCPRTTASKAKRMDGSSPRSWCQITWFLSTTTERPRAPVSRRVSRGGSVSPVPTTTSLPLLSLTAPAASKAKHTHAHTGWRHCPSSSATRYLPHHFGLERSTSPVRMDDTRFQTDYIESGDSRHPLEMPREPGPLPPGRRKPYRTGAKPSSTCVRESCARRRAHRLGRSALCSF